MVTQEDLSKLPNLPGVYIMHGSRDEIIYVGKAKNLSHRVHQYFQPSHDEGIKKAQMVQNIDHFEFIVTDSELEALILECNLIKEYRPKYNTMLRDDKAYPYIEVTLAEKYPRILFARTMKKNKSKYFGPFTSAGSVKDTIDLVQKLYKIRTCNQKFPEAFGKKRPCLNYHIGQCSGVCTGKCEEAEYLERVEGAIKFLEGDYKGAVADLTEKMTAAAAEMDFEAAAKYRDLIASVESCIGTQKITAHDTKDRDIVALACSAEDAVVQVFFIRSGKMIGREHFFITIRVDDSLEDVLSAFIREYYSGTPFIPAEIYLQQEISDGPVIENWLKEKRGGSVKVLYPKKGQKEKLVELAFKNAQMVLDQDKEKIKKEEGKTIGAMKELSALLKMDNLNRMEAFDISHISGYESVGSMVVFEGGKPKKTDYRKFKIKGGIGNNDYASMHQVLTRRFEHGLKDRAEGNQDSFTRFPDVIMMDGGKGQVHICLQVLSELHIDIPVCGMVKDDHHRTRGLYFNDVEIPIDTHSQAFHMITRLQDEAHRFAIEYHRSLRSKGQTKSFLDDIPGIGEARRKALMKAYASMDDIKAATEEELAAVPGMNIKAAEAVVKYFENIAMHQQNDQ